MSNPDNEIERRTNRLTHGIITLHSLKDGSQDPWLTYCHRHGAGCRHMTRAHAGSYLGAPWEWCDGCRKMREESD